MLSERLGCNEQHRRKQGSSAWQLTRYVLFGQIAIGELRRRAASVQADSKARTAKISRGRATNMENRETRRKITRQWASARSGQPVEDRFPDTLFAPTVEAIVDRRVWPIFCRTVAPACAGPQHVQNPTDHAAIIDPMGTATIARQQRFNVKPQNKRLEPILLSLGGGQVATSGCGG